MYDARVVVINAVVMQWSVGTMRKSVKPRNVQNRTEFVLVLFLP
jgi:hypothetical protein